VLKIISGKFKNRSIPVPLKAKFKPSTTKLREAIFSIIYSWKFDIKLEDANVLDLFCGSGSLGLEALSRGAKFATFVDISQEEVERLKDFIKKISQEEVTQVFRANATRLPLATKKYDIVLIDPPYFENLASGALESLARNDWLAESAIVIIESARSQPLVIPESYTQVDMRTYSKTKLIFLQHEQK
jgi:16S rRNA (guanine966-N2)-methyltransferase